ncbi:prepilin-type N-terminal cleavage/methylation domain-containing protein [Geobacter sp. AOG2]|uniref:type IV pilus modification PilV family protein n=1 Tax=Geobacter sp. AOG2 TaxID=1566347 RepID=UPI001CC4E13F|nr:prepilin-type N-terminal cleavage/methylation domain-containing protein [Geobacter sp. AOG2]
MRVCSATPHKGDFEDGGEMAVFQQPLRGFTLLEVMVALAIMAGVILTVLGAVNYHLTIITNERDSTALTILARAKMSELERQGIPQKAEGTLAPDHPEISWQAEQFPTDLPVLRKLVLRVWRTSDKREVVLERYLTK